MFDVVIDVVLLIGVERRFACGDAILFVNIIWMMDDSGFDCVNNELLQYEKERDYYTKIESQIVKKIRDEITGRNEYSRNESFDSRRFVYASDTCISFAQFLKRDDIFDCHFVLRSSNTNKLCEYAHRRTIREDSSAFLKFKEHQTL